MILEVAPIFFRLVQASFASSSEPPASTRRQHAAGQRASLLRSKVDLETGGATSEHGGAGPSRARCREAPGRSPSNGNPRHQFLSFPWSAPADPTTIGLTRSFRQPPGASQEIDGHNADPVVLAVRSPGPPGDLGRDRAAN